MSEGDFIAVIGMAGRFPEAPELETFWRNLVEGRESVRRFTPEELLAAGVPPERLSDPSYVPARAPLEDADCFDAAFFGYGAREAQLLDPQQRVFLECAWSALEDAGYDPARFEGPVAVFGGSSVSAYLIHNLAGQERGLDTLAGTQAIFANDKDFLATRVSYKLGLTGPSATVLTACSTALAAVHQAVGSLLLYQCDMALAGGVSITPPLACGHQHAPGMIYSPDGHCRPFDARAAGTYVGDGVGIVVLRRLEDALADGDCIRAVIRGIALNNDGGLKVGYTAPGLEGQAEVIALAQGLAGVSPESIGYLEAHGTGTPLGDPVEVAAATRAFRELTDRVGYCGLGSVKSNFGHLNAAAGAAGLIKTVLALERGLIPPSLNIEEPSPALALETSPFYLVTEPTPWPEWCRPRRAGVSSFGAGGSNVHAVLEAAPERPPPPPPRPEALLLSARSPAAAGAACQRLARRLAAEDPPALADVAFTLSRGRRHFAHRRAVVAGGVREAAELLRAGRVAAGHAPEGGRPVAFVFPAQGVQHVDMGRALYEGDPDFRAAVERAAAALAPWTPGLLSVLYPSPERAERAAALLEDQRYAGAALFALGWSLAEVWAARGIRPGAVLGHSTGEYAAAAAAGILTLEQAAGLLMARAEAFELAPPSVMLSVAMEPRELEPLLGDEAWIALINAPGITVVSATPGGAEALEHTLARRRIDCRRLRVSVPAHSPLLRPVAERFRASLGALRPAAPRVPFLSGVTGDWLSEEEARDPAYWLRHLLRPVRLLDAARALEARAPFALLELGPRRSVGGLVQLGAPSLPLIHTLPERAESAGARRQGLEVEAALWVAGAGPEPAVEGRRVPLPTYPFERQRYWMEAPAPRGGAGRGIAGSASPPAGSPPGDSPAPARHPRPALATPYRPPRSEAEATVASICAEVLGLDRVGVDDGFIDLGADSLITLRLRHEIEQRTGCRVAAGTAFGGLTVAALARALERGRRSEPAALVPLRAGGSRPPLFLAHPAAGVIFPYFELVRELGSDQPVFAFQALGLDGSTRPDRTVEEMAARYIREMRQVQPRGPYRIGGFSFGCYVSFEMARQLHGAGERVAFLGLMDELAPIDGVRPGLTHLARLLLGANGRIFLRHLHDYFYLRDRQAGAPRRERPGSRSWRAFLERAAMGALAPAESELVALGAGGALSVMFELFVAHIRETVRYSPEPFDGSGTVFASRFWYERPFFHREEHPGLGWGLLLERGVETRRVPGDHLEMVRQPFVRELAAQIREALDAGGGAVSGPPALPSELRQRRGLDRAARAVPAPAVVRAVGEHLGSRCPGTREVAALPALLQRVLGLPPPLTFRANTTQAVRDLLQVLLLHHLDPTHGSPSAPGRLLCADVQHPAVREALRATWGSGPGRELVPVALADLLVGEAPCREAVIARYRQAAARGPVSAVVIPHVVWFNGALLDAPAICGALRELVPEALILVDGAQAVGHVPLPPALFEARGADGYVGCGHKWLGGPETLGFAWIAPRVLERCGRCGALLASGDVLGEVGGLADRYRGQQYGTHPLGVARGTMQALRDAAARSGGAGAALAACRERAEQLRRGVASIPSARLLGPPADARTAVVAFSAPRPALARARRALEARGYTPAAYRLSQPPLGDFLRLSPGPDLRSDEVSEVLALLAAALEGGTG